MNSRFIPTRGIKTVAALALSAMCLLPPAAAGAQTAPVKTALTAAMQPEVPFCQDPATAAANPRVCVKLASELMPQSTTTKPRLAGPTLLGSYQAEYGADSTSPEFWLNGPLQQTFPRFGDTSGSPPRGSGKIEFGSKAKRWISFSTTIKFVVMLPRWIPVDPSAPPLHAQLSCRFWIGAPGKLSDWFGPWQPTQLTGSTGTTTFAHQAWVSVEGTKDAGLDCIGEDPTLADSDFVQGRLAFARKVSARLTTW